MGKTITNGQVSFDTVTVNNIISYTSELDLSSLSYGLVLNNTPLQSSSGHHLELKAPSGYDIICNKTILPSDQELHQLGSSSVRWKEVFTNEVPCVDYSKLICFLGSETTLITAPINQNIVVGLESVSNPDFLYEEFDNKYCDVPYAGYYLVTCHVYWTTTLTPTNADLYVTCRVAREDYEFLTPYIGINNSSETPNQVSGEWVVYCEQPSNIGFFAQRTGGVSTFRIDATVCALQLTV